MRETGHRCDPGKPLRAAHKRKPPALPGDCYFWWPGTELNCRHEDFQSPALPTELPGRVKRVCRLVQGRVLKPGGYSESRSYHQLFPKVVARFLRIKHRLSVGLSGHCPPSVPPCKGGQQLSGECNLLKRPVSALCAAEGPPRARSSPLNSGNRRRRPRHLALLRHHRRFNSALSNLAIIT